MAAYLPPELSDDDMMAIEDGLRELRAHVIIKARARRKKGMSLCLDRDMEPIRKMAVLLEEMGEVGNLFNYSTVDDTKGVRFPDVDSLELKDELLDVAMAALLWAVSA